MADFGLGFSQGFTSEYQRSRDRRHLLADRAGARKQLLDDRKLARTQGLEDAEEAAIDKIIDEYVRLGGENTSAIERRDKQSLLREIGVLQREVQNKVHRRTQQEKREGMRSKLGKASEAVQREALQSVGGVPMKGLTPGYEARTLTPTPEEFKGMDRGALAGASVRAEAKQTLANKLAQEKRDEDRDRAAEIRKRAHDLKMKGTLGAQPDPTPEVSTEDAVDKIIQMRGQLGPQGSRGPQPSREALLKMGRGKIMQLYGAFTQQVAGIVQPTQSERDDAKLDEYADEFDTASPDRQAQITRKAQTILSKRGDGKWTPEDVTKYLQSGQPPKEEVVPFKETAEERKSRLQFQHGIIRLDDLIQEADEDDFTGVFPQLKSTLLDEILPALTIDKFSDEKRMTFRHRAMILSQNLLRALNEEGKLSETDAVRILPLTPQASDDNPMFKAKLKGIRELLVDKLKLQDAGAGREDVFSLEPADFFSKLGRPDKRLGGVIVIPEGMAPSIIKLMPQYRYIGGDKSKPVTGDYISGLFREGKIDENAATLWIHYLGLPIK